MREALKAVFPSGRGVFHRRFGDFLAELDGRQGVVADQLRLAAALVSQRLELGQVYLPLAQIAGRQVAAEPASAEAVEIEAPDYESWMATLSSSEAVSINGAEPRPLVLDSRGRLYLYRYWHYEQRLAAALHARARSALVDPVDVRMQLDRVFEPPGEAIDWQRVAAALALRRHLSIVTGGAGTGKTTTVVKMLIALRQLEGQQTRIALVAPTGKAAARLTESIRMAKARLPLPAEELAQIPEEASTIHRLLGVRRHSPDFHHDAENPLALDCLVLDEASMVDLALMCKLIEALPADARLIMLGDPYQLASVEAGSVLAELAHRSANRFSADCRQWLAQASGAVLAKGDDQSPLEDTVVELQVTHRFAGNISLFAEAIKQGDSGQAARVLADANAADVRWHADADQHWLDPGLQQEIEAWFDSYRDAEPGLALKLLDTFRILCAHREGRSGVLAVNALIEQRLRQAGSIRGGIWYSGRPIMVTRNDYALRLYNGDVGLCLPDAEGRLRVWFPDIEQPRAFAPGRLPEHETVFAMTVHKTQGSEFDKVLLLLPERQSPIVNRALIYTAVTRARTEVLIHGSPALLRTACDSESRSEASASSGLLDALEGLRSSRMPLP